MESLRIPRSQSRLHFCSRLDVLAVCQKGSWWSDLSGLVQVELSTPSKLFSTAAAPATWVQGSRAASHGWTMLQGLLTPGTRAVIADGESIEAPWATALTFNLCLREASFLPVFHHAAQIEVLRWRLGEWKALWVTPRYITFPFLLFYLNLGLKNIGEMFSCQMGKWL